MFSLLGLLGSVVLIMIRFGVGVMRVVLVGVLCRYVSRLCLFVIVCMLVVLWFLSSVFLVIV